MTTTKPARRARTRSKPPKSKWGDRDRRRQDLLAAARRLLERDGYEALNMRDVARGAGVSPGTVYTYFASRELLFATLYAERLVELEAEIAPLCARAPSPEALLAAIADRYFGIYRVFGRDFNLWSLLVGTHAFPEEVAAPLVTAVTRLLTTVLLAAERCAEQLGFQLAELRDSKLVVPYVWATLSGLADHFTGQRHTMHAYSWEELSRFAARMIVAGLVSLAPPVRVKAAARPAAHRPLRPRAGSKR
jgi:AcrR family transcriptional regulator